MSAGVPQPGKPDLDFEPIVPGPQAAAGTPPPAGAAPSAGDSVQVGTRPWVPKLTAFACALCVVIFLGLHSGENPESEENLARWGYVSSPDIWDGKWWGLLTSPFIHFDPLHLFMNVYWLWLLGGALERSIGPFRWLAFVLASGWVSSGCQLLTGDGGIGFSGVGFAMAGFAWATRDALPELGELMHQQQFRYWLLWMVACFVITAVGAARIGNEAHVSGLLFGIAVAGVAYRPRFRKVAAAGIALLVAASVLALFWVPWAGAWTAHQAYRAAVQEDFERAIPLYRRSLAQGQDSVWVWESLAEVYARQRRPAEYRDALGELRKLDPKTAEKIESDFGGLVR